MEFCIADTFTDSLARLTGEEQKAVKTTAFDFQVNPIDTGLGFGECQDRCAGAGVTRGRRTFFRADQYCADCRVKNDKAAKKFPSGRPVAPRANWLNQTVKG